VSASLRRFALVMFVAFAALIANLSYLQIARSKDLSSHSGNQRLLLAEYSIQRGQIIAGGQILAESVLTNHKLKYLREYPAYQGVQGLFSFLTGYYSVIYGRTGLEESFNEYLAGKKPVSLSESIVDQLLGRDVKGNSIVLTIDPNLQKIAAQKLGNQKGAVVALDVHTGAVLAMYSSPTFDPNPLSSDNLGAMQAYWQRLTASKDHLLVARATDELYPPGSSFKPVVLAAALEDGMTPDTSFPNPSTGFALPDTTIHLGNWGGGACPGGSSVSLRNGLRVSCNATFAQAALRVGAAKLVAMAEKFGFDRPVDFDIPVVSSCVEEAAGGGCASPTLNRPETALSGIGQFGVRVTPLQMAIVAATVASDGRVPHPFLVKEVQDFAGATVQKFGPPLSAPIYSPQTARWMKELMINVVNNGTGTSAQIPGVVVGGKTGTAQTGVPNDLPHTWFISFTPDIAVAVIVEHGGTLKNEATGGKVSAPIAKAIMEAYEAELRAAKS
jgi:peptidoglycan glycosyltransferase